MALLLKGWAFYTFRASLKQGLKRRDSCLVFNRLFISMCREVLSRVATHRLRVRLAMAESDLSSRAGLERSGKFWFIILYAWLIILYANIHTFQVLFDLKEDSSFSASLKQGLKRRDSCLVFNRLFISMCREDLSRVAVHRLRVRLALAEKILIYHLICLINNIIC